MPEASTNDSTKPRNFDIEEVEVSPVQSKETVVNAGNLENWERLIVSPNNEQRSARPWITSIILFTWVACTFVGLIKYVTSGEATLFVGSNLLLLPLWTILRFYYR